eukprot:GHVN01073485.1.p1 GENE.GHVN01073485.1~~GHVN01073485.1.p1  ORF type:complete len:184 (+),score=22.38 GHVN01073485.1:347-898(+)
MNFLMPAVSFLEHGNHHTHSAVALAGGYDSSALELFIAAAVFFVVGVMGGLVPFVVKTNGDSLTLHIVNSFGGGALLGLALLHMLPEAAEGLGEFELFGCQFSTVFHCCLIGIVFTLVFEQVFFPHSHAHGHGCHESGTKQVAPNDEILGLIPKKRAGCAGKYDEAGKHDLRSSRYVSASFTE